MPKYRLVKYDLLTAKDITLAHCDNFDILDRIRDSLVGWPDSGFYWYKIESN